MRRCSRYRAHPVPSSGRTVTEGSARRAAERDRVARAPHHRPHVLAWNALREFGPNLRSDQQPLPWAEHSGYGVGYGASSPGGAPAEAFRSARDRSPPRWPVSDRRSLHPRPAVARRVRHRGRGLGHPGGRRQPCSLFGAAPTVPAVGTHPPSRPHRSRRDRLSRSVRRRHGRRRRRTDRRRVPATSCAVATSVASRLGGCHRYRSARTRLRHPVIGCRAPLVARRVSLVSRRSVRTGGSIVPGRFTNRIGHGPRRCRVHSASTPSSGGGSAECRSRSCMRRASGGQRPLRDGTRPVVPDAVRNARIRRDQLRSELRPGDRESYGWKRCSEPSVAAVAFRAGPRPCSGHECSVP